MSDVEELSEQAAEAALEGKVEEEDSGDPTTRTSAMPEWASVPANVKMPKAGCSVAFIRIKAAWTTDPAAGDRWCCSWALTETDEKLAYGRSRGDMQRAISELAKATIRIVDGAKADWSGKPGAAGSVNDFWSAIGPKGRQMLRNYYTRTHMVTDEEALDFFSNHFAITTVG
jgi:hypothetical protein